MVIKPVIFASLFTAVLVYSGLVPVYVQPEIRSLIAPEKISQVRGVVSSSPVRTSSGSSYRLTVTVSSVSADDGFGNMSTSDARGSVALYVDAPVVESLYPGRLYSALGERKSQLIEEGACITAPVRYFTAAGSTGYRAADVRVTGWNSRLSYVRALLRLQLKRLLYTWGGCGGLLLALLSGEREYTDPAVSDAFRAAGLSHILALSGMHLSLFSSLTQRVTRRVSGVRCAAIAGMLSALLFIWFAGATPSLVRSCISMLLGWGASCLFLSGTGEELLALTFLVQIALFPLQAGSVAFQLSYAALLGVFLGSRFLSPWLSRLLPAAIAGSLGASCGAFLCTAGISLAVFGTASPFGITAAVLVTPLAEWFVTAGIAGIILSLIVPFLLVPVGSILGIPYKVLQFLVQTFARLPGISLNEDL